MKRSEAVKLIHNIISDELLTTEEFNLNDCSELLKALEEAGMLPPPDYTETYYSGDEPGGYNPNSWEDEE
jgi:hypothetical protein